MNKPRKRTDIHNIRPGITEKQLREFKKASLVAYCKQNNLLSRYSESVTIDDLVTCILEYLDDQTHILRTTNEEDKENISSNNKVINQQIALKSSLKKSVPTGTRPKTVKFSNQLTYIRYEADTTPDVENEPTTLQTTKNTLHTLHNHGTNSPKQDINLERISLEDTESVVFSFFSPQWNSKAIVDTNLLSSAELNAELKARNLSTKGSRYQKIKRLEEFLMRNTSLHNIV